MWHRLLTSIYLGSVALGLSAACGAEAPSAASDQSATSSDTDETDNPIILNVDEIYSIEAFEAVGYKKVTQFDLETLPGATDAWIGFFNQKDIEIRVYPSHQMALDEGVEPAEVAVGKGAVPWQKQPPVRFDAYVVAGNVVMLCELEAASCEVLVARLGQPN